MEKYRWGLQRLKRERSTRQKATECHAEVEEADIAGVLTRATVQVSWTLTAPQQQQHTQAARPRPRSSQNFSKKGDSRGRGEPAARAQRRGQRAALRGKRRCARSSPNGTKARRWWWGSRADVLSEIRKRQKKRASHLFREEKPRSAEKVSCVREENPATLRRS